MKIFGLRFSRIPEFIACVQLTQSKFAAYSQLLAGIASIFHPKTKLPAPHMAKSRLKICWKCDFFAKNPSRCTACGCYVPYKVSATPAYTQCPINEYYPNKGWDK